MGWGGGGERTLTRFFNVDNVCYIELDHSADRELIRFETSVSERHYM